MNNNYEPVLKSDLVLWMLNDPYHFVTGNILSRTTYNGINNWGTKEAYIIKKNLWQTG